MRLDLVASETRSGKTESFWILTCPCLDQFPSRSIFSSAAPAQAMVQLSQVIASNRRIPSGFPNGLVAVFVGGTSGVGEYTLKALAQYVGKIKLRVYIVGRSEEAASRIIKECKQLSSSGDYNFIAADVSLLKSVDEVCRQIQSKETAINILFETQGSMAFAASMLTSYPL
jgi:hypothetical protein